MNRCSARLLYAPRKVTPSLSKSAGLPKAKTTSGVRTRWRIGVPGAWHSQQSHPLQSVTPTRILTASGVGGTVNLKSPTLSKSESCDVRESSIRLTHTGGRNQLKPIRERSAVRPVERRDPRMSCLYFLSVSITRRAALPRHIPSATGRRASSPVVSRRYASSTAHTGGRNQIKPTWE